MSAEILRELPWSDLKVAFPIGDDDALWAASDAGRLILPAGWELSETDGAGSRYVAIFRVDGVPSVADGEAVLAAIKAVGCAA